jgi:hypothetical protein
MTTRIKGGKKLKEGPQIGFTIPMVKERGNVAVEQPHVLDDRKIQKGNVSL